MYNVRTILRCEVCGSYDIVKHAGTPLRFKCRTCGNTFSFNVQHPLYKKHGKRLSDREKASIAADYRIGIPISHIMKDHSVSYGTVMRAVKYFEEGRKIYLWKILHDPNISISERWDIEIEYILPEIEAGRLRQGWGLEDLRRGPDAFYRAISQGSIRERPSDWRLRKIYRGLKAMLLVKPGDYIIVTGLRFERERLMIMAEVSGGYEFDGPYFFGHHVRIGRTKIFALDRNVKDPEEIAEGYDHNFQTLWKILEIGKFFRLTRRGVSVVDRRNRELHRVVGRIMG